MDELYLSERVGMGGGWNIPGAATPGKDKVVEVVLHGDEALYRGRVIRPRKLWVVLDWHPSDELFPTSQGGFIADEVTIARWRRVATT